MKNNRGIFITFEGIDGCGKSTQAKRLYRYLKRNNLPVDLIREPGGTPLSERIRKLLLDPGREIVPLAELLLYEAARAQLSKDIIIPALKNGRILICDRFFDSTTAYQGFGRGLDSGLIKRLNRVCADNISPDLTFIFDIDYKTSIERRDKKPDRLEKEKKAFFNRVRTGFKSLSSLRRVVWLDGGKDIISLSESVIANVEKLLIRKGRRV